MALKDYLKVPIQIKMDDETLVILCVTVIALALIIAYPNKETLPVLGTVAGGLVGVLKGKK